ncbi:unnamed protein product [Protopolystoma xenopodis]|uniref:Uncharacterized protein n=1 Tax=Protopolystoma xenopodis TaxID=117903 RepID=A0A448XB72_9PLAT|nr:unnamed protein product [Protopolystoma xenopodis]
MAGGAVAVHESGTYPDIEREGLHVEPGKLNEITYQPVHWHRLNTPVYPCREEPTAMSGQPVDDKDGHRADSAARGRFSDQTDLVTGLELPSHVNLSYPYAFMDLEIPYRYTQAQCILLHAFQMMRHNNENTSAGSNITRQNGFKQWLKYYEKQNLSDVGAYRLEL